ncbi:MAG: hypothetical protein KF724_04035 [Phycisphaeraceae bacterium]|nr:hypothetical protein [Phycisphaeraceae bacterium]
MRVQSRGLAGAATLALAAMAAGNVLISNYTSATQYQYLRIGIPDFDQARDGLPNNGLCHCYPTSVMNILSYAANHGMPTLPPGTTNYGLPENYDEMTTLLGGLGSLMQVSPGGGLPCGTGGSAAMNGTLAFLGEAADQLTIVALAGNGAFLPTDNFIALLATHPWKPLIRMGWGRYTIQPGQGSGQFPAVTRSNGHLVTFASGVRNATESFVLYRDPGQGGSIFTQSDYVYNRAETTNLQFEFTVGGGFQTRTVTVLDFSPAQTVGIRIVDNIGIYWPAVGLSFSDTQILAFPLNPSGFAINLPGPIPHPAPPASVIADVHPTHDQLGHFVLTKGDGAVPASLHLTRFGFPDQMLLVTPGASAMTTGRQFDVYILAGTTVRRIGVDPVAEPEAIELATYELPGEGGAIAYDDGSDEVVVLVPSMQQVLRLPADLARGSTPRVQSVPSTVPVGDGAVMAVCHGDGSAWFATKSSACVYGFDSRDASADFHTFCPELGGEEITSLDFDDRCRLHAVVAGSVHRYARSTEREWVPSPTRAFDDSHAGRGLRVARSRSIAEPDLDDSSWWNVPVDELEPGATMVVCREDLNFDGVIDGADLALLLGSWGACQWCPGDIDGDGFVDGADLALLLGAWGACR